jgi:hypothetical protein
MHERILLSTAHLACHYFPAPSNSSPFFTHQLESALAPLATAKLQPFIDSLFQQLRAESP